MYSKTIKIISALTAFSPVLLIYWLLNLYSKRATISLFLPKSNLKDILDGILQFLSLHWSIIVFVIIVLSAKLMLSNAEKTLAIISLQVKSIKSADINFYTICLSCLLPWSKAFVPQNLDYAYFAMFIFVFIIFAFIYSDSYHHNIIFRLLGYKHYEIQTKKEITFLALSKTSLIDSSQLTSCVQLADNMIINITQPKK